MCVLCDLTQLLLNLPALLPSKFVCFLGLKCCMSVSWCCVLCALEHKHLAVFIYNKETLKPTDHRLFFSTVCSGPAVRADFLRGAQGVSGMCWGGQVSSALGFELDLGVLQPCCSLSEL